MTKDTGGNAFPAMAHEPGAGIDYREGMSLRDWFAGQAMAAMAVHTLESCREDNKHPQEGAEILSMASYKLADAMIAERSKP